MNQFTALSLCAGLAGVSAGAGNAVDGATAVVRSMNALDETDFVAVRLLTFEAGQLDTLAQVLKLADAAARDSWFARLPEATRGQYQERMQKLDPVDPQQAVSATTAIAAMLNGPQLILQRAQLLASRGKPRAAAEACEKAFAVGGGGRLDFYNAACSWALAGDADAAFRNLVRAADADWIDTKTLDQDSDLKGLRSDKRWNALVARITARRDAVFAALPDSHPAANVVKLPDPTSDGKVSVEKTMAERRSVRQYANAPLKLADVSQLLWAAYGVTQPVPNAPQLRGGLKTAPSAGALYPLELYVVAGNVADLAPGVYWYRPETHDLVLVAAGDKRPALFDAAASQTSVRDAPASIVYSAVFSRNTDKYGDRGRERYVCMDLGHSAENVYLQCGSLGLGTCAIGAFYDDDLKLVVRMTKSEEPLYIMPVGRLPGTK
jgi:SagB-type dehydrogenase family enzyme